MPPLYQDPLSAVPGAWRWIDLARALVEVSCEGWALALVALAVYSFLETDVKGVLKAFVPLALALLAAGAATVLLRAFPSAQTAAVAVFATYTALVYGRRALLAVVPAVLAGVAHAFAGPHWAAHVAGGGALGAALGVAAYALTLRAAPDGHVASLRLRRRGGAPPAGPGSP